MSAQCDIVVSHILFLHSAFVFFFFFQAEDGIRDVAVTGVQTCALPISIEDPARVIFKSCTLERSTVRELQTRSSSVSPRWEGMTSYSFRSAAVLTPTSDSRKR